MPRSRPAVAAAVLLVLASATAGLVAAGGVTAPVEPGEDPVVGVSENSTRVLLLTSADVARFESTNRSVTGTLAAGHADLTTSLRLSRVEAKLAATDSREARRQVIVNATEWTEERVASLRERERAARAAYVAGGIDAETYLLTLAEIHEEATSLHRMLGRSTTPRTLANYAGGFVEIQGKISRLRAELALLRGPVRDRIAAVMQGDQPAVRVHVTVGDGVMLSTIERGQYVRETVRPDNVDEALGDIVGNAETIFTRKYPWFNNQTTVPTIEGRGGYAYYFAGNHGHGRLTVFIDASTELVYVERQWKTLVQTPVTWTASTSDEATTLLVSRTYAGGPVKVRVENATGAPIDAPVVLAGTEVGATGPDGELWTLSPAGDYVVSATHDGVTLNASVTANPAPGGASPPDDPSGSGEPSNSSERPRNSSA